MNISPQSRSRPPLRRTAPVLAIALAWCCAASPRSAAAPATAPAGPVLLLTADTEGHIDPCGDCPDHPGLAGLTRRATAVARARAAGPGALLLDAGNALYGADSAPSAGLAIIDAYNRLGYDAVNLSYRDFRGGLDATRALLRQATFPVVSANLHAEDDSALIARPYVVRDAAGRKVAVIGVTELPAGIARLPHVKDQLRGLRVAPPIEALAEWLPKARADAPGGDVVILYYGTPAGARAVADRFGAHVRAILVGGLRPDHLPAGAPGRLVATSEHGKHLATIDPAAPDAPATQLAVDPALPEDPAMAKALAPHRPQAAGAVEPAAGPDKPARVTARQPARKPRGLPGVGLTQEQVNAAIDRGADHLWKHVSTGRGKAGGKFGDDRSYDLLSALALVKGGAVKRIPEFEPQLRAFLGRVHADWLGTYEAGILCMLVDAYGDGEFEPQLRLASRWLLENQMADGSWSYGRALEPDALADPRSLHPLQVWGGFALDGTPTDRWRRRTQPGKESGDNSATQYAVLGLHAASRAGVEVPPETWAKVLALYRQRQAPDGGWGYTGADSSSPTGSMTCAGLYAVALARHHAGEADPAADEGIERGLGWLARNFATDRNPPTGGASWLYYYLYSLERAARTLDAEFVGEHEWYPRGAKMLLAAQKPDGAWIGAGGEDRPEVATSFALLFLTRGTSSPLTARPRGGRGILKTGLVEPPSPRLYLILDCSGSMLADMGGRSKFDAAVDAVRALLNDLPAQTHVALRVYGHRKRALDEGADQDTELLVPLAEMDRPALVGRLDRLRARGKTPLAQSLRDAATDLAGAAGGGAGGKDHVAVILLTDGGEDTLPRQDPVAAAAEIAKLRGVTLHVVGFDIGRDDWGAQLRAIAARGRGRYWPAADRAALRHELRGAVLRTPGEFTITDTAGKPVFQGTFGETRALPEGKYAIATRFAGKNFREPFWVNTGATTAVLFDAGKIDVTPPPGPGPATAPHDPSHATATAQTRPANAAAKFCTTCGARLAPTARFCTSCGRRAE